MHHDTYTGEALFRVDDDRDRSLSVRTETRSSTWTKLFDIYNEGLTEHNYQAYTYDFYISDNSGDEVADYSFKLTFDREVLIRMMPGDYLIYYPSSSENAMEVPIEPYEGVVPGIIIYVPIGETIDGSVLDIDYTFHRLIYSEPLFITALVMLGIWMIALMIFCITEAMYIKYKRQHDHDNEIIKESIETFTGFIDAKDPYTNGHSNRVA